VTGDADLQARLQAWLQARWTEAFATPPGALELTAFRRLASGQSSDMVEVSCRAGGRSADYVVRCEPRSKQLFLRPDVVREAQVIRGLARHGTVPAPEVFWIEPDEDVLGTPFFVMSRVEGAVPLGRPSMHQAGMLPGLAPEERAVLWNSAMEALVAIHAVDWRATHGFLTDPLRPGGHLAEHVAKLADWYAWTTRGRAFPVTDAALAHLQRRAPELEDDDPVLVWNDARVGNMIFGFDHRVAAVIDWEQSLIGPPAIDVGYWVMMDEFHAEGIGVPRLEGWPNQDETIRRYETLSGRRVRDIDDFVILGAFFIATTLIRQADIAVAAGRLPADTRMGHDNTTTQMIARRLGLQAPELSPDFAAHRGLPMRRSTRT
jgi:aminoglycoside phosphotransferase (APT) family kinase protein